MPEEERTRRARGLQRSALAHTPATWLAGQLRAIDEVGRRAPRARGRAAPSASAIDASNDAIPAGPVDEQIRRGQDLGGRLGPAAQRPRRSRARGSEPARARRTRPGPRRRRRRTRTAVSSRSRAIRSTAPPFRGRPAGASSRIRFPGRPPGRGSPRSRRDAPPSRPRPPPGPRSPRKWTAAAAPFGSTQAPTAAAAARTSSRISSVIGSLVLQPVGPDDPDPLHVQRARGPDRTGVRRSTATTSSRRDQPGEHRGDLGQDLATARAVPRSARAFRRDRGTRRPAARGPRSPPAPPPPRSRGSPPPATTTYAFSAAQSTQRTDHGRASRRSSGISLPHRSQIP